MFVDVVVIGAGPYGLSIAAHLAQTSLSFRIFGTPMKIWRDHMPQGMLLKSEGFASSLYDPGSTFTLRHYCQETRRPYADIGSPVPLETFVAYGLEFRNRFVPKLEETHITSVRSIDGGFELATADGQIVNARRVVVATGITSFAYVPPELAELPRELVTHSSEHQDLSGFKRRRVAVLGAGASALELAALLHEDGARVELIARSAKIAFHTFLKEPRPLWQRVRHPRSGLGIGWRSRLCTDVPLLFHSMSEEFRLRVVQNHLGPAPGWFVRDRVEGKIPMYLETSVRGARADSGMLRLTLQKSSSKNIDIAVDHLISATGYRVSMTKLSFLSETLRRSLNTAEDTPVLSRHFETSVSGLYMVGLASANSFGPMMRFAYGAGYTARRLVGHLRAVLSTSRQGRPQPGVELAID
ncbi:NAD(P)-binding domain-containing protein [Alloacidobacterium dinghuense]|uniref:NAD(P)-binding domain-containing protein n=1 Tax=Alloacidobacterium dinghuense TaxID=2763107 RepID=A0A7G8BKK2_9BACT|nr:FAD-dependent oxidoreductase [Alloacidobacterium dinghuense]QNI33072.1 NAD(P)-binding domain-containing protein [Alloacidobacterium dinghuense]